MDRSVDKKIAVVPKVDAEQSKKQPAEVEAEEEVEAEAVPVLPEEEQEAEAVAVPRVDQPEQEVAEITTEIKTGSSQVQQFSFESPIGVGPVKLFTGSMPKGLPVTGNFSLAALPTSALRPASALDLPIRGLIAWNCARSITWARR